MNAITEKQAKRTAPPEERRRQLIEAAMAAIADHGLSGTTTADVTRRAGLSVGLVNHHFESKENLLAAVLGHLAEEMRAHWAPQVDDPAVAAAKKLTAIVDAMFHPELCTRNKIAAWFAFFGDAGYRKIYRSMVADYDNQRSAAIEAQCIVLQKKTGAIASDPAAIAVSVEALADGLWLSLLLYPDCLSREGARAQVIAFLEKHFPGHFGEVGE